MPALWMHSRPRRIASAMFITRLTWKLFYCFVLAEWRHCSHLWSSWKLAAIHRAKLTTRRLVSFFSIMFCFCCFVVGFFFLLLFFFFCPFLVRSCFELPVVSRSDLLLLLSHRSIDRAAITAEWNFRNDWWFHLFMITVIIIGISRYFRKFFFSLSLSFYFAVLLFFFWCWGSALIHCCLFRIGSSESDVISLVG